MKVFKRTGGREGKGICREMRAERGKGGYCKVPVEFKFLQYCCGITYDTGDTYNTSRYCRVPIKSEYLQYYRCYCAEEILTILAIPTILQVHTILEKLLLGDGHPKCQEIGVAEIFFGLR